MRENFSKRSKIMQDNGLSECVLEWADHEMGLQKENTTSAIQWVVWVRKH